MIISVVLSNNGVELLKYDQSIYSRHFLALGSEGKASSINPNLTHSLNHLVVLEEILSFEARALKLFTQANRIIVSHSQ